VSLSCRQTAARENWRDRREFGRRSWEIPLAAVPPRKNLSGPPRTGCSGSPRPGTRGHAVRSFAAIRAKRCRNSPLRALRLCVRISSFHFNSGVDQPRQCRLKCESAHIRFSSHKTECRRGLTQRRRGAKECRRRSSEISETPCEFVLLKSGNGRTRDGIVGCLSGVHVRYLLRRCRPERIFRGHPVRAFRGHPEEAFEATQQDHLRPFVQSAAGTPLCELCAFA